jgi:hypothetical protein
VNPNNRPPLRLAGSRVQGHTYFDTASVSGFSAPRTIVPAQPFYGLWWRQGAFLRDVRRPEPIAQVTARARRWASRGFSGAVNDIS